MHYQNINITDWINQMKRTRTRPTVVQPAPVQQPVAQTLPQIEAAVHSQINQVRQQQGLSPLTLDATISEQARIHSQNMADGKVPFSHEGFQQRVQAISVKISYSSAAENVAYNMGYDDPASQAVQGWIKSPGHYTNIVGDSNLTGIGVVKNAKGEYYFTQIFIKTR
jgi:uncharacterized protein YkwD